MSFTDGLFQICSSAIHDMIIATYHVKTSLLLALVAITQKVFPAGPLRPGNSNLRSSHHWQPEFIFI